MELAEAFNVSGVTTPLLCQAKQIIANALTAAVNTLIRFSSQLKSSLHTIGIIS